jgi:hypothetical protein
MARSRNCQESRRLDKHWTSDDPAARAHRRHLIDRSHRINADDLEPVRFARTDCFAHKRTFCRNIRTDRIEVIFIGPVASVRLIA